MWNTKTRALVAVLVGMCVAGPGTAVQGLRSNVQGQGSPSTLDFGPGTLDAPDFNAQALSLPSATSASNPGPTSRLDVQAADTYADAERMVRPPASIEEPVKVFINYMYENDSIFEKTWAKSLGKWGYRVIPKDADGDPQEPADIAILKAEAVYENENILHRVRRMNPHAAILLVDDGFLLQDITIQDARTVGADNVIDLFETTEFRFQFILEGLAEISRNRPQRILSALLPYQVLPPDHPSAEPVGRSDYIGRILSDPGGVYLLKNRKPVPFWRREGYVWPEKNVALREYLGFRAARALGANACDVVIPPLKQRELLAGYLGPETLPDDVYLVRLSHSYHLGDKQVIQKEFRPAFTRNFLVSFLMRRYDLHRANHGPLADAEIPMMFDYDQSFHFKDVTFFSRMFIANFWPTSVHLRRIFPDGMIADVNAFLEHLDFPEIIRTVRHIQAWDVAAFKEQLKQALRKYPFPMDAYFAFLETSRKTFAQDIVEFFKTLEAETHSRFHRTGTPPKPSITWRDVRNGLRPSPARALGSKA